MPGIPVNERTSGTADAVADRLVAHVRETASHVVRMCGTPGLGVAVLRGDLAWEAGFGFADLDSRTPRTPDTVFRSGSMGKIYTSTAVMHLVERGVLQLADPVNAHLKDVRVENPLGGRDVTVEDLLTHRSGLAENAASCHFVPPDPLGEHLARSYATNTNDFYGGAISPRWTATAGERFQYSNTGMATLGYLVEGANPEGLSFDAYVKRFVVEPLGMSSSLYPPAYTRDHVPGDLMSRVGTGYMKMGPLRLPSPQIWFADYPAGNVLTTPGDHAKLLVAHMRATLLKRETVDDMLTPRLSHSSPGIDVGLMWMIRRRGTPEVVFGHSGAHMWGWTNISLAWPRHDTVLVVSANQWNLLEGTHAPRYAEGDLLSALVSSFLAAPGTPRAPRTWPWKVSYVAGLTAADRLKAYLGTPEPLTEEMVASMASGGSGEIWDEDGFRAGVRDLLSVEPLSPHAIRDFLRSERLQVHPAELRVLNRELDGREATVLAFDLPE